MTQLSSISSSELVNLLKGHVFYKYRSFKKISDFKALSNREIYFSSYQKNRQDDPLEGIYPIEIERASYGEIYSTIRRSKLLDKGNLSSKEFNLLLEKLVLNSPLFRDPKGLESAINEMHEIHLNSLGLFCTSKNPNSNFCWNKFASNHQGFVIGYSGEGLFSEDTSLQKVEYFEVDKPKIPWKSIIKSSQGFNNFIRTIGPEILKIKYCIKPSHFENEEEWRFIKGNIQSDAERIKQIDEKYITVVILGKDMNEADRQTVLELCEQGKIDRSKIISHKDISSLS